MFFSVYRAFPGRSLSVRRTRSSCLAPFKTEGLNCAKKAKFALDLIGKIPDLERLTCSLPAASGHDQQFKHQPVKNAERTSVDLDGQADTPTQKIKKLVIFRR